MKIPPLIQMTICCVIAIVLATYLPLYSFEAHWLVVVTVGLAGTLFLLPAVVSFVRQNTTVNPQTPSAATTLVTNGVYGVTRNPMYVGMLLLLLSFALWIGDASAFVAVLIFFLTIDRFQIRREEESLRQIFGPAFEEYAKRVPKWLFF